MTVLRRWAYRRGWYRRECNADKKKRKREYHRKIRRSGDVPMHKSMCVKTGMRWNTVT